MKKAPEPFRTIGEVADLLETPAHVLRFWESKFYQIKPVKRAGGRRYYRPDDVALISGIRHLLQDKGMTIRGVQKLLQEEGVRHVVGLAPPLADDDRSAEESPLTTVDDAPGHLTAPPSRPASVTPFPVMPSRPMPGAGPGASPAARPVPDGAGFAAERAGSAGAHDRRYEPAGSAGAGPVDGMGDSVTDLAAQTAADQPAAPREPAAPLPAAGAGGGGQAQQDERPAQILRGMQRGTLGDRADRLTILAGRIDRLLDRMSEASGAGRW